MASVYLTSKRSEAKINKYEMCCETRSVNKYRSLDEARTAGQASRTCWANSAGLGECLGDQPSQEEYVYPEQPAGVMFDAATQCHLQFGAEAAVCAEPSELCQHLWCLVNGTCKTMLRPAAPGTSCGPDMEHEKKKCNNVVVPGAVVRARAPAPRPRDGGWGAWGAWSACSRSCGAGVSTQTRACDSPQPEHNGKYCIGERSRYKICNTDPCPVSEMSFREIQCSKFKNQKINNETIEKWIPYFDQDRPCELSCIAQERNDLELNDGFVADGTPCRQSLGARDLCIAGRYPALPILSLSPFSVDGNERSMPPFRAAATVKLTDEFSRVCHKVGCDWIVDSEVEEDACGVCGGDGSACKTVQGIYNKGTTKQTGFSEVAVIPAGSRNVKIQEKVNPGNYISIGSAKTKKVYLSGKRYDSSNATLTEYLVAGSPAIYERDRDWEKVRIPGPIIEDIKVYQRIYRGRHRNPGVTYQYTVDRQPNRRRWRLSEWSPCSASCGIGYSRQRLVCIDDNDRKCDFQDILHDDGIFVPIHAKRKILGPQ
ncbi:A disintegrin and metalloproteinase with thrombospondin motifs 7 [Eumeta japonica]|uniref:A disintegrin and metalloproteinase with thrombospondin motifs 7 n=1 Tax=Eumeta variegata TaxID=151549 RepID=A0A4C1XG61_EUMVA|nr:A disintegrin and metalloproteinase with thrombospondin motifs 7 [Eumeta japonica]